jgi:hypothetical protein
MNMLSKVTDAIENCKKWCQSDEGKLTGAWFLLAVSVGALALSIGFATSGFRGCGYSSIRDAKMFDPLTNHAIGMSFAGTYGVFAGGALAITALVMIVQLNKKEGLKGKVQNGQRVLMIAALAIALFGIGLSVGAGILQKYQDPSITKFYTASNWQALQSNLSAMRAGGISTAVIGSLVTAGGAVGIQALLGAAGAVKLAVKHFMDKNRIAEKMAQV